MANLYRGEQVAPNKSIIVEEANMSTANFCSSLPYGDQTPLRLERRKAQALNSRRLSSEVSSSQALKVSGSASGAISVP